MDLSRDAFLGFCAEITGYSPYELEGTGVVDTYHELLPAILGADLTRDLAGRIARILAEPKDSPERARALEEAILPPSVHWPVVSALVSLWYLGVWNQLPDSWYESVHLSIPGAGDPGRTHVPSVLAYTQQLSYRTALAHAPGANPTGFGSWSYSPI